MTTFAIMKARVLDEITRPDLTTNDDAAVLSAIEHYKYRRFYWNTDVITDADATTANSEWIAYPSSNLPSGVTALLSIDAVQLNDGNGYFDLERKSNAYVQQMNQAGVSSGVPYAYAEYDNQIRVTPPPTSGDWDVRWYGIVEFTALSADGSTNAWVTTAEELIRERAKAYLLINIVRDEIAIAERNQLALMPRMGDGCLSLAERYALRKLTGQNVKKFARGRAVAHEC